MFATCILLVIKRTVKLETFQINRLVDALVSTSMGKTNSFFFSLNFCWWCWVVIQTINCEQMGTIYFILLLVRFRNDFRRMSSKIFFISFLLTYFFNVPFVFTRKIFFIDEFTYLGTVFSCTTEKRKLSLFVHLEYIYMFILFLTLVLDSCCVSNYIFLRQGDI